MYQRTTLFFVFLLVVVGTSCGKRIRETGPFESWVQRFEMDSATFGNPTVVEDVRIEIGDLDPTKNGLCMMKDGEPAVITIQRSFWEKASAEMKEVLIYHELGHCILRRNHKQERIRDSYRPVSIMHSEILEESDFVENREAYLSELFSLK